MKIRHIPLILCSSLMLMGFDLAGLFSGTPSNTFISGIAAGPYKPGARAIGVDKDLNNMRAIGNGLIPENELNTYLNGIKDRLLTAVGIQNYPGGIYIRAAMLQWGGETTPDGNIFINAGTLRNLESEDEVAAVIAHELSHALLKHHDADVVLNTQKRLQTAGEWVAGLQLVLTSIKSGSEGQVSDGLVKRLRNAQYLILLNSYVLTPAWSRGQESDADRLGVDLLAKAGYNFYAMHTLLAKDEAWQKHYAGKADPRKITEGIAEAPGNGKPPELEKSINQIFGAALKALLDALSPKHPDPVARQQTFRRYVQKHYRGMPVPEEKKSDWVSIWNNPRLATIRTNYEYAFRAESTSDPKEAATFASLAIRGPTSSHAYPLLVASQVFDSKGDRKTALSILEQATQAPETVGLVYLQLASIAANSGDHTKALQSALSGYAKLNNPPNLRPLLIKYYKMAGDKENANAMALTCGFEAPEYKEECLSANKDG